MKTLGILGGMGPLATADLFKRIVLFTQANCDQEHIKIILYNNTLIPDRTEYLVDAGENPLNYLIQSAQKLEAMGADYLIMPCNTAHYFYDEIIKHIKIPFIHMIKETGKFITKKYKKEMKIGLLATEGVYKTGVYDNVFINLHHIEIVKPDEKGQKDLMGLINNIKKGKSDIKLDGYHKVINELKEKGVNVFVLGCTELSVVYHVFKMEGNYVDPMEILALKAITFSGKKIKERSDYDESYFYH